MAKSLPGRVDLMVVVGLEDQPRVHLHHVVAADQRPTPAAWQHLALKLRPVEATAIKMKHASAAVGSIAETGYLNFESEREQKPGVDLRHGGLLMTGIRHVLQYLSLALCDRVASENGKQAASEAGQAPCLSWVKLRRTQNEQMSSGLARKRTLRDTVGMSQRCQHAKLAGGRSRQIGQRTLHGEIGSALCKSKGARAGLDAFAGAARAIEMRVDGVAVVRSRLHL